MVGGANIVGSVFVARILFGFNIGIFGLSVGEKFISPNIVVVL